MTKTEIAPYLPPEALEPVLAAAPVVSEAVGVPEPAAPDFLALSYEKESSVESRWPAEVEKIDRLYVATLGSLAALGSVTRSARNEVIEHFKGYALEFRQIKRGIGERARTKFDESISPHREDLQKAVTKGRKAHANGDANVATHVNEVNRITEQGETSRLYRWASKLGLAPSEAQLRQETYTRNINEIILSPNTAAAEAAKARGDRASYNAELERLSATASRLEASGATPEQIAEYTRVIDKQLGVVRAGEAEPTHVAHKEHMAEVAKNEAAERRAAIKSKMDRVKHLTDIDHILDLKQSIDTAVDKATREATILPGRTQVGFDADKIRREATEKQIHSYFGTSRPELNPGDKRMSEIELKVRSLLNKSDRELEDMRKKK